MDYMEDFSGSFFHLILMEHLALSAEKDPNTLYMLDRSLVKGKPDSTETTMVPPERMCCIWDMFVKNGKVASRERERRHLHRSSGVPKFYPFTQLQLDQMSSTLETLKENQYPSCRELGTVLDEYVVIIHKTKRGILARPAVV